MSQSNNSARPKRPVDEAVSAFMAGKPVLIHDAADREGETDMVYPAAAVTTAGIARMRNDAGGLICVALTDDLCKAWELPFVQDALDHPMSRSHELEYDDRASFSVTVNHRETFTGITDEDRAQTVSELGAAAGRLSGTGRRSDDGTAGPLADDPERFAELFRSPGHVPLLRAAPGLLDDRKGHTELGLALADESGIEPAVAVCEMLDDESGGALSPAGARQYADRCSIPYIEGSELIAHVG